MPFFVNGVLWGSGGRRDREIGWLSSSEMAVLSFSDAVLQWELHIATGDKGYLSKRVGREP